MAARRCSVCGKPMNEGFYIEPHDVYLCDKECMVQAISEAEYEEMYEDGLAYWTQWDEDEEAPEEKWRVCYKEPGKPIEERVIDRKLEALQGLVGGYIEIGKNLGNGVVVLCDEEGYLKGKPYNCMGLLGPLVFIGVNGIDFRRLTDEEVGNIMKQRR